MPYYKRFLYVAECIHSRNVIPELFFRHIWRHFRAPCQPVFRLFADSFNMLNKIKKRTFFLKLFLCEFYRQTGKPWPTSITCLLCRTRYKILLIPLRLCRSRYQFARQMSSEAVKLSAVRLLPLTSEHNLRYHRAYIA